MMGKVDKPFLLGRLIFRGELLNLRGVWQKWKVVGLVGPFHRATVMTLTHMLPGESVWFLAKKT